MFCKQCGSENPEEAVYCRNCGSPVTVQEINVSSPAENQSVGESNFPRPYNAPAKRNKTLVVVLIVFIGILVLSFTIGFIVSLSSDSESYTPEATTDTNSETTEMQNQQESGNETFVPTRSDVKELFLTVTDELETNEASVDKDNLNIEIGDIDQDGDNDALLQYNYASADGGNAALNGGLLVFINDGSQLSAEGSFTGESIKLDYIDSDGNIHCTHYEYADDDPRCCPSIETTETYSFKNGDLIKNN